MKILFTKTGLEKEIIEVLGTSAAYFCVDMIEIQERKISAFKIEEDVVIFTSSNGADSFIHNGLVLEDRHKVFTVGEKAKKKLELHFQKQIQSFSNANQLSNHLRQNKITKVLHFCGNLSVDVLENEPECRKIELYETKLLYPKIEEKFDTVCFFSPSGVRSFAQLNSLEDKLLFSIGKTTETEIKMRTKNQVFTSQENNVHSVLQRIKSVIHNQA